MIEWRDPEHPASADVGGQDVWPELTRTQAPNAAELVVRRAYRNLPQADIGNRA